MRKYVAEARRRSPGHRRARRSAAHRSVLLRAQRRHRVLGGRRQAEVDARALRRLENIRANTRTTLLVDFYDDDWEQLWWVRLDATGRVLDREHDPSAEFDRAVELLREQVRAVPSGGANRSGSGARYRAVARLAVAFAGGSMQRWRVTFVVATTSMLLAVCGGASAHATTRPSTVPGSTAGTSAPSASGCGHPLTAGSQTSTITVDGRARTLIVHIPHDYTDSRAVPLVLNLHGSGSNAAQQELLTGMDATADAMTSSSCTRKLRSRRARGSCGTFPEFRSSAGRPCPRAPPTTKRTSSTSLRSCASARASIPKRVYATGFSGGARMSSQLACDASTTFAAVAPVSGLRLPTPCPARRAVPVISFHGRAGSRRSVQR